MAKHTTNKTCPGCGHPWHCESKWGGICIGCPCNYGKENSLKEEQKAARIKSLLERAAEMLSDNPPDSKWFRDYFLVTGERMFLGEEGWEPESAKKNYLAEDSEWEPDDEVNVPAQH
jgi:hypothetical protein